MNLTLTLDEEIVLLEKYGLTPNELFVLRLILIAVSDGDKSLLVQYLKIPVNDRVSLLDVLKSLQSKGIILKSYKLPCKGEQLTLSDIEFNKNFIKGLFRASFEMGKELFEHYPQFAQIGNNYVPIRGVSKKYDSLEDAYRAYGKAIRWSQDMHKEVLELVDWGKENNVINTTLCNFIIDNKWNDLKALKDGNGVNINYNAIKIL